jgi:REP element-mobilizing transposase RayT
MPDHVHLLFTPLTDTKGQPFSLIEIMSGIKGASAHSLNRAMKRRGPVWQEESFDHVLRSAESLEDKVEYIALNPVTERLVEKPGDYRWLWIEEP